MAAVGGLQSVQIIQFGDRCGGACFRERALTR